MDEHEISLSVREYIREYVNSQVDRLSERISATDRLHDQESVATARAIDKAEQQMNSRLLAMNEFRDQLKDQAATFVSKAQLDSLQVRVEANERIIANYQGRLIVAGGVWSIVVIVISFLANHAYSKDSVVIPPPVMISPTPK